MFFFVWLHFLKFLHLDSVGGRIEWVLQPLPTLGNVFRIHGDVVCFLHADIDAPDMLHYNRMYW